MNLEFSKGDKMYPNWVYWETRKGQHFIFYNLLPKLRINHTFLPWGVK